MQQKKGKRNAIWQGQTPFPRVRRGVLAVERGGLGTGGDVRVGLVWPDSYRTGMSSLGFLWAYDRLNTPGVSSCERFFYSLGSHVFDQAAPLSLERGMGLGENHLVAVSIAAEGDLLKLIGMLERSGIPALCAERADRHPAVVIGGPLTRANPFVLTAFGDVVAFGDGEPVMERLIQLLAEGVVDRQGLVRGMAGVDSALVQEADDGPWRPAVAGFERPVVAPLVAEDTIFSGMRLVEVVRGCPRGCAFCVCSRTSAPWRAVSLDDVVAALPAGEDRFGFIGAGIADYPQLAELLAAVADRGGTAGVSSVRADRVTPELVENLRRCGAQSLTLALDGASERLRGAIRKQITAEDLLRALDLARDGGVRAAKIYCMLGLPDETDGDLEELTGLLAEAADRVRVTLALSPFVPKRGSPLADAPFLPVPELNRRLKSLRKLLPRGISLSQVSPRDAWIEQAVDRAGGSAGPRLVDASRRGGRFRDWRRALH